MDGTVHIGMLCAELKIQNEEILGDYTQPISANNYFKQALRFADTEYKAKLEGYDQKIREHMPSEKSASESPAKKESVFIHELSVASSGTVYGIAPQDMPKVSPPEPLPVSTPAPSPKPSPKTEPVAVAKPTLYSRLKEKQMKVIIIADALLVLGFSITGILSYKLFREIVWFLARNL